MPPLLRESVRAEAQPSAKSVAKTRQHAENRETALGAAIAELWKLVPERSRPTAAGLAKRVYLASEVYWGEGEEPNLETDTMARHYRAWLAMAEKSVES